MASIIRTSLPAFTIVDQATLEQWLRIDASVDEQTVDLLLASATDYLEGLTGQVLASANYIVVLDPAGGFSPIGLTPFNGVLSVAALFTDGTAQTLTAGTQYTISLSGISPVISFTELPDGTVGVSVACNAGYTSAASVPASLQHAAAVLVAAGYDNRSALDPRTIATVDNLIQRYRAVGI